MQALKDRIQQEARVEGPDVLKVDNFLNHQVDVNFLNNIGQEFYKRFQGVIVDKILTVEASGIAIACIAAQYFNVPVVFAKKTESKNLDNDCYVSEIHSFTKNKTYKIMVSKRYLQPHERVLVIDDFLANGKAVLGLKEIIRLADADMVGAGIVIEKGFQPGGKELRQAGIRVESLVIVETMQNGQVTFR